MPYAIPAWNAMTGLLPHAGALPIIGAMNPLALGVGTVVLLLLTEKYPAGATRIQALMMRMNQLAIPMFIGFLLGGVSGMAVAVGISRLYTAYTKGSAPERLRPPTPSLAHSPTLAAFAKLSSWYTKNEGDAQWTMKPLSSTTEEEVINLINSENDPALRLQLTFTLINLVPYASLQNALLPIVFKTLFSIPDTPQFQGNNIIALKTQINDFISSYSEQPFILSHSGQPPLLEDLLRFFVEHVCVSNKYPGGWPTYLSAILNDIIKKIESIDSAPTLDQLIQLSHTHSQSMQNTKLIGALSTALDHKKNALDHKKNAPDYKISNESLADRLKIAQVYCSINKKDAAETVLKQSVALHRLCLKIDADAFQLSLHELAALVGAGYLKYEDVSQTPPNPIDPAEYNKRRQKIDKAFNDAVMNQQQEGRSGLIEGIFAFLQQLDCQQHELGERNGYRYLIDRIEKPRSSQTPFTFDELVSAYTLCAFLVSQEHYSEQQDLREALKKKIQEQLGSELEKAEWGDENSATKMTMDAIAAAHATDDPTFAIEISRQYGAVAGEEAPIPHGVIASEEARIPLDQHA